MTTNQYRLVLACAVLLHWIVVAAFVLEVIPQDYNRDGQFWLHQGGDEIGYHNFAQDFYYGKFYPNKYPLGFPLLLLPFLWLGVLRYDDLVPLVSAFWSLAMFPLGLWLTGWLGQRWLGRGRAALALILLALLPLFVYAGLAVFNPTLAELSAVKLTWAQMYADGPAALFTLLALAAFWRAYEANWHWGWLGLSGALCGALVLIRFSAIITPAGLALILLWQRQPLRLLAFGLPTLLMFIPQMAYNAATFGSPLVTGYTVLDNLPPHGLFHILYLSEAVARLVDRAPLLLLLGLSLSSGALTLGLRGLWRKERLGAVLIGLWLLGYASFYATYYYSWSGGLVRFLVPAMPALALLLAAVGQVRIGRNLSALMVVFGLIGATHAQMNVSDDLPPCEKRPASLDYPRAALGMCVELVAIEPQAGALAFAALAVGDDGTLYAARPLAGQVWALTPGDDGLPANPTLLINDLTLPNALTFVDGALYVVASDSLWRWRAGELTRLVDDLPSGPGFWTGGLASDGRRLFVGIGAPCDSCPFDRQTRGVVLSYDMEGRDKQLVARGLRHPQALAIHQGALWIGDSARQGLRRQVGLDELNRLLLSSLGQVADFGFPRCLADGRADGDSQADCEATLPPAYRLATHSQPLAMTTYRGEAFPTMQGDLLLVLGGDLARPNPNGYQLVRIEERSDSVVFHSLIPFDGAITGWPPPVTYNPETGYFDYWANYLSTQRAGFYPHSPLGVAVSPQGWIYVSSSNGVLLALRPID
ncbi:MAG: hypothetical protein NZ750_07680 [Anaerolineae bacterium]|nr:hypothetical protein [Anaerolineae bacterium]MDW8172229.1 hypothetical protein [Anaerolineae bacterium]